MLIYNVTVQVEDSIREEWLTWMRSVHIPEVLDTGCFLEAKISQIHAEDVGGVSYSIQYLSPSKQALERYQQDFAPTLQQKHTLRYEGKFVAFRTILSLIDIITV